MASSFLDTSARLGALTSKLAAPTPTATAAPTPTQSVGSFQNQQLGGILSKTGSSVGSPLADSLAPTGSAIPQTAVGQIANTTLDSVKAASQRLGTLSSVVARRRTEAAQAAQTAANQPRPSVSAPVRQQTVGSTGRAYQSNGQLSAARNQALATASSYIGDRYVLGGLSHNGIDCSGLIMAVYDQLGFGRYIDSHGSIAQGRLIPGVRTSVANLRPGDIVAWNNGSHIAIYAGNGEIIEAANPRVGVVKRPLWSSAVTGIQIRLPGE